MNVTGHTILIAGAGAGIDCALAAAFRVRGNDVIVAGSHPAPFADADGELGIVRIPLDAGDPRAIRRFAARVASDHPALDVLVNAGGIAMPDEMNTDPADPVAAEAALVARLLAPIQLTSALLPHLCGRPAAAIITLSPGIATVPIALASTYCATRATLRSYDDSLRLLLQDRVAVIDVALHGTRADFLPRGPHRAIDPGIDACVSEILDRLEGDDAGDGAPAMRDRVAA